MILLVKKESSYFCLGASLNDHEIAYLVSNRIKAEKVLNDGGIESAKT